jgi:hypothetical protein
MFALAVFAEGSVDEFLVPHEASMRLPRASANILIAFLSTINLHELVEASITLVECPVPQRQAEEALIK